METFVGGKKLRPEIGETCVAIAGSDGKFRVISPNKSFALSDEGWEPYAVAQQVELSERDVAHRRILSANEDKYWAKRHERASKSVSTKPAPKVPAVPSGLPANNAVDNFIDQKLAAAKATPTALLDDDAFLRRATLDTIGLVPTPDQIKQFKQDKAADRRAKAIDRLLTSSGWADHWVSYWQDVLAENPGMLKPQLNNTGPFRWWIYESFLDNKPIDRFVTERVMMEGSRLSGGPAGFAMATQNDSPMAA